MGPHQRLPPCRAAQLCRGQGLPYSEPAFVTSAFWPASVSQGAEGVVCLPPPGSHSGVSHSSPPSSSLLPSRPNTPAPSTVSQALRPSQPPACPQVKLLLTGKSLQAWDLDIKSGLWLQFPMIQIILENSPRRCFRLKEEQGMKRWV